MRARHALPTLWLMTDPRLGDALWTALERLPRGAGVVFRHEDVPGRRALFERVRAVARRRGLVLLIAGSERCAVAWRADGFSGGSPHVLRRRAGLRAFPAHDPVELRRARRVGADLVFLSPVYPTRTHPGAPALGRVRFGLLARRAQTPVIALGGMDARRARATQRLGAIGWAGIDAFATDQKRKAVPI